MIGLVPGKVGSMVGGKIREDCNSQINIHKTVLKLLGLIMEQKQQLVEEMIKRKELSALNQLMTQIDGVQRLKNQIRQVLHGGSLENHYIFQLVASW